jgi:phosphatidylserine/phosphatidylglycerophosphate/cardiolipin synthase-like enzyme
VFDEAATDPVLPAAARFQWHVIEHAVQAEVRRFTSSSISVWRNFALSDSPREPTPFNGLTPATMVEQINVNTCLASDLEALPGLGKRTAQRAGRPRFWKPSTERLMRGSLALDMRDAQRGGLSTGRAAKVAPVPSGAYIRLLESLIDSAEQRIWCQMFFFHVGNEGSPGDRIVTKLREAVTRGVDVRLILDHDLPGDHHNARQVNEAAFEALHKAKVPVRPSHPDITAHGKTVVFDADRVLCGSHNWTSSSFFR